MTYLEPLLSVCIALTFLGWLRLRRCEGSWLVGAGLLGFILISWPPIQWVLSRPLEVWYPVRAFSTDANPKAIVVLSSSVDPIDYARPYDRPDLQTLQRCEFAAWLHTHWRPLPILATGGSLQAGHEAYSATMRRLLARAGIPVTMIWTEDRSRSTHENAVFGAQILRMHGVKSAVIVVEASSMLRAAASFRKQGITVIPAPCNFRQLGPLQDELLPSWKAIRQNEVTLHEIMGLAWYRVRGWI